MRSEMRVASIMLSRLTAPVEVREMLACQDWATLMAPWAMLVSEWSALTTCHRFELYVVATEDEVASLCTQIKAMLTQVATSVAAEPWLLQNDPWIVRYDEDAADHLCRVAAGLDSLVLGEAQIQGQVIATYTTAVATGTIGPFLSNLFRTAIRVGKRARTETSISTRAASMSSVALAMAARHFAEFAKCRVLVIGAGEMSRLALKALLQRNVLDVTVANRTLARAETALMHPQWRAVTIDEAVARLGEFDVIFSATSAPTFVLTHRHVEAMLRLTTMRNGMHNGKQNGAMPQEYACRPRVLIDLAMPRDIEPTVRQLPDVVLVDVDDLRQGIDTSLEKRKQAMPAVNRIIADELGRWRTQQRELALRPYVVALRQSAERIRQQEVERTLRFLGPVDEVTRTHIQHLSQALVNKLLHAPTMHLKNLAHEDDVDAQLLAIQELFALESGKIAANSIENTAIHGESLSH